MDTPLSVGMRPEDPTYFPDPRKYPGVWVLLVLMVVGLGIYVGVNTPNEDPVDTPTQDLGGSPQN